jgi:hypothetical protein
MLVGEPADPSPDGLDEDIRDQMVAIGRGVISLVPFAGGPLAEIVGAVVPTQRADRIAAYLRALTKRIDAFEVAIKNDLIASKQKIDLIEEGGFQAARALSDNRIEQIVEAVAAGISADEADIIRRKRLLVLLGELDDDEVNLLNAYGRSFGGGDENAWDAVNRPDPTHMQSSRADVDRDRLYEAGRAHLLRLGLIKKNYGNVKKGELPVFDARKGDFKHTVEIAYLGGLLLREIGMTPPFDDYGDD